jgi:hypothetical protein
VTTSRSGKKVGRKSHVQLAPRCVALAQNYCFNGLSGRRSLREVAYLLAKKGFLTRSGKPFGPAAIRKMIQTPLSSEQREALEKPSASRLKRNRMRVMGGEGSSYQWNITARIIKRNKNI